MADSQQLTEERKTRIIQNKPELMDTIELSRKFWAYLSKYGVITVEEIGEIQRSGMATPQSQLDDLLNHVMRSVPKRYVGFLRALVESGHTHIVTDILGERLPESSLASTPGTKPSDAMVYCGNAATVARDILRNSINSDRSTPGIQNKTKYLKITLINMDPNCYLLMEKDHFKYGRFWDKHPVERIQPYTAVTFPVCNRDNDPMGISGGVGFGVFDLNGKRAESEMFICSFSDPLFGMIKGKCTMGNNIERVRDEMDNCDIIRRQRFGFYKNGDTDLTFIWKSKETSW